MNNKTVSCLESANTVGTEESIPSLQEMNRRSFLRTGLLGGTILATSGITLSLSGCTPIPKASGYQYLTSSDIPFIQALFKAVLGPALPSDTQSRADALEAATRQLDTHCSFLSKAMQDVLRKLFDVATMPLTRGLTTGMWQDWSEVDETRANQFLDRWQHSRLFLFRMAHAALVQLMALSWYGLPESFEESGYPGVPYPQVLVTEPNHY